MATKKRKKIKVFSLKKMPKRDKKTGQFEKGKSSYKLVKEKIDNLF